MGSLRNAIITLFIVSVGYSSVAQVESDTSQRYADIIIKKNNNKIKLSADTPPLEQIAGAPTAFYTYFWEFGDGHYSREEEPQHEYKEKDDYTVRLQVTNNYDNGKPPPSRPTEVSIDKIDQSVSEPTASVGNDINGFDLLNSREPVPEEEIIVVMRYKNEMDQLTSGKLHLYYNEMKFKENNFKLVDIRTHHEERKVQDMLLSGLFPSGFRSSTWASIQGVNQLTDPLPKDSVMKEHLYLTIDEADQQFRDRLTLEFDDLPPQETRNVFLSMQTTPEMIQDTSAIIKIRGVFVPDRGAQNHQVKDLEMEIVTSHDPNKMAVNDTRINYRFRKNKKLKYKVRFQNNGEGPATTIKLKVDVPPIIDKSTLEVIDMYPKCPICPQNDQQVSYSCLDTTLLEDKIVFTFKNIYLPGSNQKGVEAYDSTKGFVKYQVMLKEEVPKINSTSRTSIIFDKNEPILTNYAKTYFKPGLSLGFIGGFRSIPSFQSNRDYFFGVTASPYMPYHGYFQAELMLGIGSYESNSQFDTRFPEPGTDITEVVVTDERIAYDYTSITLVPVSYRYNVNKFFNVGGGVQLSTNLRKTTDIIREDEYFIEFPDGSQEPDPSRNETITSERTENFTDFNPGIFAGVNLGSARIGPCAGVRYVYQLKEPHQQLVFYINWKF